MRKKIEIEETVPGKISGNVHVLDADTFCNNNKDCLPETCITSIKNLKNGKFQLSLWFWDVQKKGSSRNQ